MTQDRRKRDRRKRDRRSSPSDDAREAETQLENRLRRASDRAQTHDEAEKSSSRRRRPQPSGAHVQAPLPDLLRRSQKPSHQPQPRAPRSPIRHADLSVIAASLAVVAMGAFWLNTTIQPQFTPMTEQGLAMAIPQGWLQRPLTTHGTQLNQPFYDVATPDKPVAKGVQYISPLFAEQRIEVTVEPIPTLNNTQAYLDLRRVSRYGKLLHSLPEASLSIEGRDWKRTQFRYARSGAEDGHFGPGVGREFYAADRDHLYVVTLHATPETIDDLSEMIAPSLRIQNNRTSLEPQ